jgi:hypothetical protein
VQVEEANVSRTRDLLNKYNPTDIHNESSSWRSEEGWSKFDETATPYKHSDVETYRSRTSTTSSNAIGIYPTKQ